MRIPLGREHLPAGQVEPSEVEKVACFARDASSVTRVKADGFVQEAARTATATR